jgi:hypothetical protein
VPARGEAGLPTTTWWSPARVSGKPRVVSQEYLGTAEELAAAMRGGLGLPGRVQHKDFGAVAAAWGFWRILSRSKIGFGW